MYTIKISRFFYLLFSFLLVASLPLSVIAQITTSISEMEINIIDQNPDIAYLYLGRDRSNIADLVSQLCDLDENINSPLHTLHRHISNGFSIAKYDEIVNALEYAAAVLDRNNNRLHDINKKQLVAEFLVLIEQVQRGSLSIDSALLEISDNTQSSNQKET